MKWFTFKLNDGKLATVDEIQCTTARQWYTCVYIGTELNYVCARDELDAFKIINRWLSLGCPEHYNNRIERMAGRKYWWYDEWELKQEQ